MKLVRSLLAILPLLSIASLCASNAFGRPLTEADIRNTHRLGIMLGSFDPVTNGHLGTAEASITEGGMDATIMLPIANPTKNPLPVATRLKMIDLAAARSSRVLYPKSGYLYDSFLNQGIGRWVKNIRQINPNIEIYVVVGSDISASNLRSLYIDHLIQPKGWMTSARTVDDDVPLSQWLKRKPYRILKTAPATGISSSGVKKFLREHSELDGEKVPNLNDEVAKYVARNRLYKDVREQSSLEKVRCASRSLSHFLSSPWSHP
jgi:nicotinic acid mononucleotide adenylyltransferase